MVNGRADYVGFQFIGFPSEWGGGICMYADERRSVSNLLGSPASGESLSRCWKLTNEPVSNLLGSPASGEWLKT